MFQLKFDESNEIVKDIPHWEDIPDNIKDYIEEISNRRIIYDLDSSKFYCSKCIGELDDNYHCKNCNVYHDNLDVDNMFMNSDRNLNVVSSLEPYMMNDEINLFVFDISLDNVYLYLIHEDISYESPFYHTPFKTSKLSIDKSRCFFVEKNGVTNIYSNEFISYDTMSDDGLFAEINNSYLYLDNILELKKTIYKYSKFWKLKDLFKYDVQFSVPRLTKYPLYYESFEYLINYGLYSLAFYSSDLFKTCNNFKEIFGVEKKYLPFMKKYDINYSELEIMRHTPCDDYKVIEYYYFWYENFSNEFKEYNIDLIELKNYLEGKEYEEHDIPLYIDYIRMASEVGMDISDKNIRYPEYLIEDHDNLLNQIDIIKDPDIDKKIREVGKSLAINNYEDDIYVIYPPMSIKELIDESKMQHNCVRTYAHNIAEGKTQVYFMRKKDNANESFVTIEIRNDKIVQARIKFNKDPDKDVKDVLNRWESTLINITID